MKRNKILKKIADNSIKELSDNEFKEQLVVMQRKQTEEKKNDKPALMKTKLKATVSAFVCVVIIAILIPCFLFFQTKLRSDSDGNNAEKPSYSFSEVMSKNVELEEINAKLSGYELTDSEYIRDLAMYYDKKSGDKLYYRVIWENYDTFTSATFYIVINKYCDFFDFPTLKYDYAAGIKWLISAESEFFEKDNLYYHKVYAKAEIEDVRIYVYNYDSVKVSDDSGFSDFIEKNLIKKDAF